MTVVHNKRAMPSVKWRAMGSVKNDSSPQQEGHTFCQVESHGICPFCLTALRSPGFDMSDAQKVHASTAEHLVPSLEALRHKICSFLSEKNFWMIYFVLLLPGLQEHDAKILSTPKIVEVREILLQNLQNKRNASVETSEDSHAVNLPVVVSEVNNVEVSDSSQGKVLAASVNAEQRVKSDHEKTEQSPEEEDDARASSIEVQKQPESGEDVSFSYLEDDDYDNDDDYDLFGGLSRLKPVSPTGSNEWVRLQASSGTQGAEQKAGSTPQEKDSEGEDSFDWLTIDEVDLDHLVAV